METTLFCVWPYGLILSVLSELNVFCSSFSEFLAFACFLDVSLYSVSFALASSGNCAEVSSVRAVAFESSCRSGVAIEKSYESGIVTVFSSEFGSSVSIFAIEYVNNCKVFFGSL